MKWTTPAMQRHDALAAYLTELGLEYGEDRPPVPEYLSFRGETIELDPWERQILQSSLCGSAAAGDAKPFATLVAEGIAFEMKCRQLIAQLDATPARDPQMSEDTEFLLEASAAPLPAGHPAGPPAAEASGDAVDASAAGDGAGPSEAVVQEIRDELEMLVTDAAVGLALLNEAQRAIDQLIVSGERNSAKKLTSFRNRLCQSVGQLRERLGSEEYERAENKSEGMVSQAASRMISGSTGTLPGTATRPGPRGRKPRGEILYVQDTEPESNLRTLGLLFLALSLVWMIFFMPRMFQETPHVIETSEVRHIDGVESIVARPPSLFVTVDAIDWRAMSKDEQVALVEEVGKVASASGYLGADVRSSDGEPLGAWFDQRGAELAGKSGER